MKLIVSSPETTLFEGEISLVQLSGTDGKFEIMDRHAPMISMVEKSTVRIVDISQKETNIPINGGILEIKNNRASILVL